MQFFSSKHVSRPPDSYPKAVSNINSNSPRYSNSKLIPRCGPPRRIRSHGVAPPAGSNPTMWPPLLDRILRCGPSRRIESYGVALPAGLNPTVWPSPRDRLPHRGIVRIFFESMLLHLKRQSTKNVCMVEHYYPRLIIFML